MGRNFEGLCYSLLDLLPITDLFTRYNITILVLTLNLQNNRLQASMYQVPPQISTSFSKNLSGILQTSSRCDTYNGKALQHTAHLAGLREMHELLHLLARGPFHRLRSEIFLKDLIARSGGNVS